MADDTKPQSDKSEPLEVKILSCTAEFYIASQERHINAYVAVPLDLECYNNYPSFPDLRAKAQSLGCEAITDVRGVTESKQIGSWGYKIHHLLGMGLILKTEKSEEELK